MKNAIAKWGNSTAIRLPKKVVDSLNLEIGDELEIEVKDNVIMMKKPTSYIVPSIDEIINSLTPENQPPLLFDDSVGDEI